MVYAYDNATRLLLATRFQRLSTASSMRQATTATWESGQDGTTMWTADVATTWSRHSRSSSVATGMPADRRSAIWTPPTIQPSLVTVVITMSESEFGATPPVSTSAYGCMPFAPGRYQSRKVTAATTIPGFLRRWLSTLVPIVVSSTYRRLLPANTPASISKIATWEMPSLGGAGRGSNNHLGRERRSVCGYEHIRVLRGTSSPHPADVVGDCTDFFTPLANLATMLFGERNLRAVEHQ